MYTILSAVLAILIPASVTDSFTLPEMATGNLRQLAVLQHLHVVGYSLLVKR